MKTYQKVLIVVICGGAVWGLGYAGSIFPAYAMVTSSFAAGLTGLCGMLTGYPSNDAK